MIETTDAPVATEIVPNLPCRNSAIRRCCEAHQRSLEESRTRRDSRSETLELAIEAYKDAMPDLCGYESIRDFIACTTHGMLIEVIDPVQAAKLLYAAQVAIGAFRLQPGE
jgi:hypothetical protein